LKFEVKAVKMARNSGSCVFKLGYTTLCWMSPRRSRSCIVAKGSCMVAKEGD
jgi:hypothetical protein